MSDVENSTVDDFDNDEVELDEEVEVVVDTDSDEEDAAAESDEGTELEADDDSTDGEEDAGEDDTPRGRWAREKRLREEIIRERDTLAQHVQGAVSERDRVKAAATQIAEMAHNTEEEAISLKRQNAALQKQFADVLDYAYNRDIDLLAKDLRRAREDGNYDEEIQLQGKLDKLRFEQNQIRQAKTSIPDPDNLPVQRVFNPPAGGFQQQAPQQQAPAQAAPPAPRALKWLADNKTWFTKPEYAAETRYVLDLDAQVNRDGYDKNSDDYYKELDKRINKAFPNLRSTRRRVGGPVAPAGGGVSRNVSKKTMVLKPADLRAMQKWGMDINNKEHLRAFAKSKRTSA